MTDCEQNIITLAEKVMGWKYGNYPNLFTGPDEPVSFYWRPYESISDAWMVVDKLRKRRLRLIINDTGGAYRARFFDQRNWSIYEWVKTPDAELTVWRETACEAICAAALASLEPHAR